MKWKTSYIFIILCILFLVYSFSIYLSPQFEKEITGFNKKKASQGQIVWQKYNCQSCHQLYGLGGYLGPDLTNIISTPYKGEIIVRALIKSGIKQMPSFDIPDEDIDKLIEFLKSADASGIADPRSFQRDNFGMIEKYERK